MATRWLPDPADWRSTFSGHYPFFLSLPMEILRLTRYGTLLTGSRAV